MNPMRLVWTVGGIIAVAAVVLALMGDPATRRTEGSAGAPGDPVPATATPVPASSTTTPAPATTPAEPAAAPANPAPAPAAPRAPVQRAPDAVDLGLDAKIKEATVVAGNIVPKKDAKTGEELLYADGKYEIRGKGTPELPYRMSWECLASASESYMPRLNEREIPQRVAMLDGKVVEIEGYLAFPLMVSETKELLVMLNQWDGCCIGVPPTPYDAIEVKLLEPAKRGGRHATFNFGGVRGTLRVDPYLVENWLVGLYILEGARMVEGARPEL
ncbi:MAG: hypothetical protein ACKPBA_01710 [Planctomycetota bacterium]